MTPEEFIEAWRPDPMMLAEGAFEADVALLVECVKAEARRGALEEAERAVLRVTGGRAAAAIFAIPRWNGITPFTKEKK